MKNILVGILLLLLASCTDTNPEGIMRLKVGMSLDEAIAILGEPNTKEYRSDGYLLHYSYSDSGHYHVLCVYIKNYKVDSWY